MEDVIVGLIVGLIVGFISKKIDKSRDSVLDSAFVILGAVFLGKLFTSIEVIWFFFTWIGLMIGSMMGETPKYPIFVRKNS